MRQPIITLISGCLAGVALSIAFDHLRSVDPPSLYSRSLDRSGKRLHSDHGTGNAMGGGELVESWNAKLLVDRDLPEALRLCMEGETVSSAIWEAVLRGLAPENLEDAIALVNKGRCFSSRTARNEASRLLLSLFPLESLIAGRNAIESARGIGHRAILSEFVKEWMESDPEACFEYVKQLKNPWSRQQALAAAISNESDLRSQEWIEAVKSLRPSLWDPDAIESAVHNFIANEDIDLDEKLDWLDAALRNTPQWANILEQLFRESLTVEEAHLVAEERELMSDPQLMRQLLTWAAEENPGYYLEMLDRAQSVGEMKLGLRTGLEDLSTSAPELAIEFLERHPSVVDRWSLKVVLDSSTLPNHFKRVEELVDQAMNQYPDEAPLFAVNYLFRVAKMSPGALSTVWDKYHDLIPDEARQRYIQGLAQSIGHDGGERAVALWIQRLRPDEAKIALQGFEECCGN